MKNLIFSLITVSTLGIAIAAPLKANAVEVNVGYKTPYQKHWQFKGEYGSRVEAEFSARRLRYDGYIARIDRY
jgi:hypothetical protein